MEEFFKQSNRLEKDVDLDQGPGVYFSRRIGGKVKLVIKCGFTSRDFATREKEYDPLTHTEMIATIALSEGLELAEECLRVSLKRLGLKEISKDNFQWEGSEESLRAWAVGYKSGWEGKTNYDTKLTVLKSGLQTNMMDQLFKSKQDQTE